MNDWASESDLSREILACENVSISFNNVPVLRNMQIKLYSHQAVAIVGENGAGKSTLTKILTGIYKPELGSIYHKGRIASFHSIKNSKKKFKIAIVHQEQNLCEQLSVAQNIFLGNEKRVNGFLSSHLTNTAAKHFLELLNADFSETTLVKNLTVSQRQFVEIAKALSEEPEIIIFDEPTSVLTNRDTEKLFEIVTNLKQQGIAVVWITHRMEEIERICEQVLIIKDGNYVVQKPFKAFQGIDEIVNLMVGRELENRYPPKVQTTSSHAQTFEIKNLNSLDNHNINLVLRSGEICCLYGLVGSGRSELAQTIFGAKPYISGDFWLNNQKYLPRSPKFALKNKIFYLSEDRKQFGLNVKKNIEFNINLANLSQIQRAGFLSAYLSKETANKFIKDLSIKAYAPTQPVDDLSGGNQQKVAIAKGLNTWPELIIFDEPTRGVDVGARKDIYEIINKLKQDNKIVLVISSDLPEVIGIADRVVTFFEGKITNELIGREINESSIIKNALSL
ncbi:ribose transport system ATP-binding protein [Mycoplasmoides fastidiosum]|uniref:Ribose transport system ATP-binding protein n=1 Tax=Mycoplasmoides fastidiosum TaxID=92758 RepID=A0ABU0LZK7_9BACT|nr:sugar ABC transporter ATP-binding protein [Mycoplasmoides fastidiosum]MDQ0514109.1 ribose transport system ATP-binding protein [Mycoplasmoides fastidiosum]UUD37483.1 sugar ABC transporter ATP-binding protein [Mycoplasmoides fastidiosum]